MNASAKLPVKNLRNPIFFQTEETDTGSIRGHAQLRNSATTAILKSEEYFHYQFNQGIFIDIFPLDNVPDDPEERQAFVKSVNQLKHRARQFYNYCNGYPNKNLSGLKQFLLYTKFFFLKRKRAVGETFITTALPRKSPSMMTKLPKRS